MMDLGSFMRRLFGLATCVAVAGGCSGDGGGDAGWGSGEGSGGSSSEGELLVGEFQAECDMLFTCGCDYVGYSDASVCAETMAVAWAGIVGLAAEAGLTTDLACYKSTRPFATYGCKTWTEVYEGMDATACAWCQHAFGGKAVGEPCTVFGEGMSECAQGLRCVPGPGSVCVDPCALVAEGESCGEFQRCADGLLCWGGVCRGPLELGEPCELESWLWCADGLVCDPVDGCTEPRQLGEPCVGGPWHDCAEGLFCAEEALVCTMPAGPGQDCASLPCVEGYLCEGMICTPPPGEGQPCPESGSCAEGLVCDYDSDLCVPPPGLGEECSDSCEADLWCDFESLTCVPLPGDGEPCGGSGCGEGLFCDMDDGLCEPEPAMVCVEP